MAKASSRDAGARVICMARNRQLREETKELIWMPRSACGRAGIVRTACGRMRSCSITWPVSQHNLPRAA